MSFFGSLDPKFLDIPEDKRILTVPFLEACRQILPFFDILGKAFTPVKSDIDGNIVKLQKKYDSNKELYTTLNSMLEDEVEKKTTGAKDSASISLLWLRRAVSYMATFLGLIAEDNRNGTKSENLVAMGKSAYEKTLKPYHTWIVQKVFNVIAHATPKRAVFVKTLALGTEPDEDRILADIEDFVIRGKAHVEVIGDLLVSQNLDSKEKV